MQDPLAKTDKQKTNKKPKEPLNSSEKKAEPGTVPIKTIVIFLYLS